MRRIIVFAVVVVLAGAVVCAQERMTEPEVMNILRQTYPYAARTHGGLRVSLSESGNFVALPAADIQREIDHLLSGIGKLAPQDVTRLLLGSFADGLPWKQVPIGLAVNPQTEETDTIYVTKERGVGVLYRVYYDLSTRKYFHQRVYCDEDIRLVVIFGGD